VGSSLDDLRDFPKSARRATGFQLDKVQNGEDADDWKPMPTVGNGVHEIRVRDEAGAFRLVYVEKTRTTARKDLALARDRYQEVLMRRKSL
jgi:phage-related protein